MNKLAIALLLALGLAGCKTTLVDQSKFIVIEPPVSLYSCPQVAQFPKADTLTNRQVAETIEKLIRSNRTCKINMDSIRTYVGDAKRIVEEQNASKK